MIAVCAITNPASAQNLWQLNGVPVCLPPDCGAYDVSITPDDSGGVFVQLRHDINGNEDIYLKHLLSDGTLDPRWPLPGVPATLEPSDQYPEAIVSDGTGGLYVLWSDYRYFRDYLFAQHVLANGQRAPGWPVDGLLVAIVPYDQYDPELLADGVGGIYVAWSDPPSSQTDVYATRITYDGLRAEGWLESGNPVSNDPGSSAYPRMTSDGAGGLLIAWSDSRGGQSNYAQRLNPDGSIAPGWQVNGNSIMVGPPAGFPVGLVPDGVGGAYLGLDFGPDFEHDAYLTRFTGDGVVASGWSANGLAACATTNSQIPRSISSDGFGGVLLTWTDYRPGGQGVYAIRVLPDGSRAPGWQTCGNKVSDIGGFQSEPIIIADGTGGAYVAFEGATGTTRGFIQKLTPQGAPAPGWTSPALFVDLPGSGQQHIRLATDARGGAITAWLDARYGVGGSQIYAQRYGGDGPTPAQVSLVSAHADPDRVTLTWHTPEPTGVIPTIYRRTAAGEWTELSRERFDGEGLLRYKDLTVSRATRYAYRLGILENGVEWFTEENWVDVPAAYALALEGVRPNPAVHELRVAFALPSSAPASLELIDIGGRQVMSRAVSDLGAGRHLVQLGDARRVPPGVYWVRLTQSSRSHTLRAVVVR